MLKTLIIKEMRELIGSTKFALTFGACAVLIIASFYAGGARYLNYRSQYETALAENLQSLEGNTDWNAVGSVKAVLPPSPLASLVSGVSNDIGRTAEVRGRGEPDIRDSRYNDEPVYAVFRFLDLEFLFTMILSLFAILLGYDAVSGEKERGTLRLAFANALPRPLFLLGKLIGSSLVLIVSLLIAVGVGLLLLPLMGVALQGGEWVRLGLIILTGFLYTGVFLTASIAVSALTRESSHAFLILLVVWISAVLIIPRVSVLTAGRAVDVPSVDQIAAQKAEFSAQLRDEYLDALSEMSIPMDNNDSDPIQLLNQYMDSLHGIRDAKMLEYSARLNEERHNRQQVQSRAALWLARLSPMTPMTLALGELANSSVSLKDHFYDEAINHSTAFGRFKREKTGLNTGATLRVIRVEEGEEPAEPERIDPGELPVFDYRPPQLAESLNRSAIDIGLLAVFNILFMAGALVFFNRYDLR